MAIWGAVSWGCNKVEEGNSRQWLDFMCILHLWHWNCHGNVKSEVQELKCFDGQSRGFWCHSSISIRGCNICSNAVNQMIVFLIFTCKTVNHYLKYFCHSWKIWTLLKSYTTTLLYNSLCTIWGHIEKGTWGIFKDQYDLMRKQDGDFLWNQIMWKYTQFFINKREWR